MPETMDNDTVYSIGALSKMVGVSTDTLRYYDEIGLFKPFKISEETGYRYYTNDQAATFARIMELKYYGFSLNEIKEIINQTEINLTDVYLNRYWVLENEKRLLQDKIDDLSKKINKREDFMMNKKILIVDDAEFMRSICKQILSAEGYDVVGEACDGLEAIELYKRLTPDIVLLDIVMPNCDGIDALRRIKECDEDVHAVMLSAMSQTRIVAEALLAGAREFICKPFQAEALVNKVRESFHQPKLINREIAQQLYDACIDDKHILSQQDVELIIKTVHSQADAKEAESVLVKLKSRSPAEKQGYDSTIEQRAQINARLDKLERGQHEILELLKSIKNNK